MFNELAVTRSKTKTSVRVTNEAFDVMATTMMDVLNYVNITTADAAVVEEIRETGERMSPSMLD